MTLTELHYIVTLAQKRHFRRAADELHVSQPALSIAVQKLEKELGVTLFERSRQEVGITPIGSAIVAQAQRTLDEASRIPELAHQGRDHLHGTLRLGAIHTIGPYLLPGVVPILKGKAPRMPLEVEENTTAALTELLANGRMDVIIIALPFAAPGLVTRAMYDEDFNVVIPSDHHWSGRKNIQPPDLGSERVLLLNTGHCFSNQVREACPELRHRSGDVQQGNSLETIRNMVASGLGIAVLPASANCDKYRSPATRILPFSTPAPARRVALAWRKSFVRTDAIDCLADAVRSVRIPGIRHVKRGST